MIPADLGAELTRAIGGAVAAGEWPAAAADHSPAGTWRPPPDPDDLSYATSLPFELARVVGTTPAAIAGRLARALRDGADWISSAEPTGDGYLTVRVTSDTLVGLAVRIARAGPDCARGTALGGTTRPMPPLPDLAAAPSWQQAWRDQAAALTGRLAAAAGATPAGHPKQGGDPAGARGQQAGPVAGAVAYAGVDAVRYGLARALTEPAGPIQAENLVAADLTDPYYTVRFACADTVSTLRWAADLGLRPEESGQPRTALLGQPAEAALAWQLSWLGERVAGAARRQRPAELPRCLERTARAWLECRESCPALPFGGQAAPDAAAGISARLWLAKAAGTVLATGLQLVGVTPPERL